MAAQETGSELQSESDKGNNIFLERIMCEAFDDHEEKKFIKSPGKYHNYKPQPTPDTKRKRKMTKTNTYKTNKQMHEKHTDQLPLPKARWPQC